MDAVRFEHVSKRFVIRHERARTFQEAALNLARLRRGRGQSEEFWALRDVSFTVERGRTLGIIGRNGAGKSTLLKLLAGTMRPTSGTITVHGRVFGLLELAAGFHPELSGRENVFLNGTFLGLSRREMAARLDQIVAFAELEQFIDTPVKHYSSGMYMRLGFAIAISVDPDVLVIDEVLAVGDASFRQKCFLALAEVKAREKTILFVTHDPAAVRRFCDDAIWLESGRIRAAGPAQLVLREYLAAAQTQRSRTSVTAARPADPLAVPRGPVRLLAVDLVDRFGQPVRQVATGEEAGIRVRYHATQAVEGASIGIGVHRADGIYVFGTSTAAAGMPLTLAPGDGEVRCWLGPLHLGAAAYTASAALWLPGEQRPAHRLSQHCRFSVGVPSPTQAGLISLAPRWEVAAGPARAAMADGALRVLVAAGALSSAPLLPVEAGRPPSGHTLATPGGSSHPLPPSPTGGEREPARHDRGEDAPLSLYGRGAGGEGESQGRAARSGEGALVTDDAVQLLRPDGFYARWRPAPGKLVMGEGDDEFLGPGWYPPEDWPPKIRWTARRATAYLTQDEWASSIGITLCRPLHRERPLSGRVLVAGRMAGAFATASPQLESHTFPVEPVELPREVEVTIEVDETLTPAAEGLSDDVRELGVAVRQIWFE